MGNTGNLGETRIKVHLNLRTEISHVARLSSPSAAHSLPQFISANGGLHCLFSAAYTMHQICLPGTRYYLQDCSPETRILPCTPEPAKTTQYHVVFQLSAGVSYATSLLHIKICHFWDQCNRHRWWSVTNRMHPSCCTSLKKPAANSSFLISTAHFCALRNADLYTAVSVPTADRMARKKLKLQGNRFNTGQYAGQRIQPLFTKVKIHLQPERSCFFLYRWDFQFPDEEMKWCDIKQLMNFFN